MLFLRGVRCCPSLTSPPLRGVLRRRLPQLLPGRQQLAAVKEAGRDGSQGERGGLGLPRRRRTRLGRFGSRRQRRERRRRRRRRRGGSTQGENGRRQGEERGRRVRVVRADGGEGLAGVPHGRRGEFRQVRGDALGLDAGRLRVGGLSRPPPRLKQPQATGLERHVTRITLSGERARELSESLARKHTNVRQNRTQGQEDEDGSGSGTRRPLRRARRRFTCLRLRSRSRVFCLSRLTRAFRSASPSSVSRTCSAKSSRRHVRMPAWLRGAVGPTCGEVLWARAP